MKNATLGHLLIFLLGLSAFNSQANDSLLRTDHPDNYKVVAGDTLWDISKRFLSDPWRWKEVWEANTHIKNPHLIYPGDTIRLVYVDGEPQLVVDRPGVASKPRSSAAPRTPSRGLPTVKLSPKIRSEPIKTAIPIIPLDRINQFLLRNRVVEATTLTQAPYVVSGQERRVIVGAGDQLYARGNFDQNVSGYRLYRQGQRYIDPTTKEVLGVQAVDVGAASLYEIDNDVATLGVNHSSSEIRPGDRLLPNEERLINSTFLPSSPEGDVEGLIITVEKGVSQVGRLDVIAVNLGRRDAIVEGNVLAIDKRGETLQDRFTKKSAKTLVLPNERAGLVMVFQVFEKMSLAIVLEAGRGVGLRDIVRTPY